MEHKTDNRKKDDSKMRSLLKGLTSASSQPTERKTAENQKEKQTKTVLCVSIDAEKAEKIRQLSKIHGVPVSTVIEEAVSLYITRYEEAYGQVHTATLPSLPKV